MSISSILAAISPEPDVGVEEDAQVAEVTMNLSIYDVNVGVDNANKDGNLSNESGNDNKYFLYEEKEY